MLAALALSGCASVASVPHIEKRSPQFYTGTRVDWAAIRNDEDRLEYFRSYSITPARYPLLDLPLSFFMDTVIGIASTQGGNLGDTGR